MQQPLLNNGEPLYVTTKSQPYVIPLTFPKIRKPLGTLIFLLNFKQSSLRLYVIGKSKCRKNGNQAPNIPTLMYNLIGQSVTYRMEVINQTKQPGCTKK
jgi:hypothetical protein